MQQTLIYFLFLILSYFGLVAGIIISNFAKEELNAGKKYFQILKTLIFAAILFFFMQHLAIEYYLAIPLVLIISILSYLWEKTMKHVSTEIFFYSFFAIVFYELKYPPIVTLLIFIYGMASASIKAEQMQDIKLPGQLIVVLSNNLIYIIMGILLKLVFRT
jgi:hypothetical protein